MDRHTAHITDHGDSARMVTEISPVLLRCMIIRVAPGGEMLGGACVQMAFNLGNAIGAYVGGLALGGGYRYPALAGVPFALTGFILFVIFYKKFQSRY